MPRASVFTRYGGPEVETFFDVDKPVPGDDELLVAVRAAPSSTSSKVWRCASLPAS